MVRNASLFQFFFSLKVRGKLSDLHNKFLQFIQTKYLHPVKEIDQCTIRYEKVVSFTTTCQLQSKYSAYRADLRIVLLNTTNKILIVK